MFSSQETLNSCMSKDVCCIMLCEIQRKQTCERLHATVSLSKYNMRNDDLFVAGWARVPYCTLLSDMLIAGIVIFGNLFICYLGFCEDLLKKNLQEIKLI